MHVGRRPFCYGSDLTREWLFSGCRGATDVEALSERIWENTCRVFPFHAAEGPCKEA